MMKTNSIHDIEPLEYLSLISVLNLNFCFCLLEFTSLYCTGLPPKKSSSSTAFMAAVAYSSTVDSDPNQK